MEYSNYVEVEHLHLKNIKWTRKSGVSVTYVCPQKTIFIEFALRACPFKLIKHIIMLEGQQQRTTLSQTRRRVWKNSRDLFE